MPVLQAYLDESGTHADSKAVSVVAAVATEEVWSRFKAAFAPFLAEIGISSWHHRDFDRRRRDYGVLTDAQWVRARDRLCEIIADTAPFVVGASVSRAEYEAVRKEQNLPKDPYEFCLERCLDELISRVFSANRDDGIEIYYDNKKQYGRLTRLLARRYGDKFKPISLSQYKQRQVGLDFMGSAADPHSTLPFAIADILAFEACEYVRAKTGIPFLGARLLEGVTPEPRPIIGRLVDSQRAVLMVKTYTRWFLDFEFSLQNR